MSLPSGVVSSTSTSKSMGLDEIKNEGAKEIEDDNNKVDAESEIVENGGSEEKLIRQISGRDVMDGCDHEEEEEEEEDEEDVEGKLQLGPQCSLKEQFEKDKDDESLRRWKEQLLGSVDVDSVGETLDPEVKILSLAIKSPGRSDIVLPIPESGNPKGPWFTLKEGSIYCLEFKFKVCNNIVSGLKYHNTVWKTGLRVDRTKEMIGTFSPQQEPYTHEMHEETTPSGMFARGSYTAKSKFLDDDNKCYLEINYTFDIRKDWLST